MNLSPHNHRLGRQRGLVASTMMLVLIGLIVALITASQVMVEQTRSDLGSIEKDQLRWAAMPPGKKTAWTASINQRSIDVIYRNQPEAVLRRVFGKPDRTQGDWLGYTGLKIIDANRSKYSVVWFGFVNGVVQQVRFAQ